MSSETKENPLKRTADEANIKKEKPVEPPGGEDAAPTAEDTAPSTTDVENENTPPVPEHDSSPDSPPDSPPSTNSATKSSNRKNSNKGRHGDPRMHRAVAARLLNPELSLLEALLEGGFIFPEGTEGSGKSDRNIFDSDGVLLCQRKNQLSRRLRLAKKRQQASRTDGSAFSANGSAQGQGDSRTLQNMLLNGQLPISGGEIPMMPTHQFPVPFYPGQPGFDPSALGADGRPPQLQAMDGSNMDQYLQQTARSMGLRPDQFQQSMRQAYPNQAMFPGYPGAAMNFQQFPGMPNQPANFMNAAIDQQRTSGNSTMENMNATNTNSSAPAPGTAMNAQTMQGMQMPAMLTIQQQQQQQQYNNEVSRMLLNRSLLMNVMEQQHQQQQGQPQPVVPTQPPQLQAQESNEQASASA